MSKNETHKEKMERKKRERASRYETLSSGSKTPRKTVVKLSDVKTPTTVEEFRENLSRFFMMDGGTNNLMVMGNDSIPIEEISSFDDIYTITGTGFGGDGSSPSITPSVEFTMDDVKDFMDRTGLVTSFTGFFDDEDNFTLYDDKIEFLENSENVSWYTLDNQILRGFYSKVLGDFSGYRGRAWIDDTRSKYMSSLLGMKVA